MLLNRHLVCRKLIQEQNEHERNLSEMLKKSKGKRADFEDQELSRISAQLQKALAVKLTAKKDALNKNRGSSRTILMLTKEICSANFFLVRSSMNLGTLAQGNGGMDSSAYMYVKFQACLLQ